MIRPSLLPPHVLRAVRAATVLLIACAAPAAAESPDYSGWQRLLDRYCVMSSTRKQPFDTMMDYGRCFTDEKQFTGGPAQTLDAVRMQLLAVPPSRMNRAERLAWAINTYNFLVFDRIARNVVLKNTKTLWKHGDVREVLSNAGPFFETELVTVEGKGYSLETFERRFVYEDSTLLPEPRRTPGDPRLMCALMRGCMGGPPLMKRAFRPDSLEQQLDFAARTYLALPRIVAIDAKAKQIRLIDYLAWHAIDYGGVERVFAFLDRYGTRETRAFLKREKPQRPSGWIEFDWLINHAKRHVDSPPPVD